MAQKTIKFGNAEIPLDDSTAQRFAPDVITESRVFEGMVHLGLGGLIVAGDSQPAAMEVKGDLHLRVTPLMAARMVKTLIRLVHLARDEATARFKEIDIPGPPN